MKPTTINSSLSAVSQRNLITLRSYKGRVTKRSLRKALNFSQEALVGQIQLMESIAGYEDMKVAYFRHRAGLEESVALRIIAHLMPDAIVQIGF